MSSAASWLVAASAAVILALGSIHLLYTFRGRQLHPRDLAVLQAMSQSHLVLTRQTTVWRAWLGFNASHSLGAMFFGTLYLYLSLCRAHWLFDSTFLCGIGLAVIVVYAVLAHLYWFSIPRRGILLAGVMYGAGWLLSLLAS